MMLIYFFLLIFLVVIFIIYWVKKRDGMDVVEFIEILYKDEEKKDNK